MMEFSITVKPICLLTMTLMEVKCRVKIEANLSDLLGVILAWGDTLSCLLFNSALEKPVRDSGLQREKTIHTKSIQLLLLLTFEDDVDTTGWSYNSITEAYLALKCSARQMALFINEEKTKYQLADKNHASATEFYIND